MTTVQRNQKHVLFTVLSGTAFTKFEILFNWLTIDDWHVQPNKRTLEKTNKTFINIYALYYISLDIFIAKKLNNLNHIVYIKVPGQILDRHILDRPNLDRPFLDRHILDTAIS